MIGKENYEKNKIYVKRNPIENYWLNNGVCVVINKELTCPYFFFGDLIWNRYFKLYYLNFLKRFN